ncbi:hypothetical protein B0H14DRAFT_2836385 [Mycena olivaceomarginata]|nr:hypothetical protein B0H14DRAFT_2836385 [Mycena olivaceomarginata]
MAAESLLIVPNGPTLLDSVSELPINALDVFGYAAANAYIVPELIDVPRFTAALAKTLVLFPLYAARVRCAEGGGVPWVITLPPQGIPLTIASSSETSLVPIEAVVQKPLRFLPSLSTRNIVLDPSAPLATILLTHFPELGLSCIGVTRWHPIGSDYVASRFMRALSKNYLGVEPVDEPEPVYKAARASTPAQPANIRLDFRLSLAQLQQLRDSIHALGGPTAIFLTPQDCLVALIVCATNASAESGTPPIHTITTILDVRGVAGVPAQLSFNGFTFAPTDRISVANGNEDYYAYAFAVRKSLARAREPAFLSALLDLQATRATEAAARGEVMDLASPPGHMLVNSTLRLDRAMRPEMYFGHAEKGRSYVGTVPFVRHLKLARPNPAVSADGTWRERLDEAEVTLFFQPAERERFMQEINERAKALGIEGGVEWVERS